MCSSEVVFYRDGWRQDIDICAIAGDNGYSKCAGACLSHEVQGPPASAARCTFTAAGARARQMSVSSTVHGRAVSRLLSFTVWSRFDSGLFFWADERQADYTRHAIHRVVNPDLLGQMASYAGVRAYPVNPTGG